MPRRFAPSDSVIAIGRTWVSLTSQKIKMKPATPIRFDEPSRRYDTVARAGHEALNESPNARSALK